MRVAGLESYVGNDHTSNSLGYRVSSLETSFPAGCNTIMQAVTAKGQTPASNSPTDIATAISNISGGPEWDIAISLHLNSKIDYEGWGGDYIYTGLITCYVYKKDGSFANVTIFYREMTRGESGSENDPVNIVDDIRSHWSFSLSGSRETWWYISCSLYVQAFNRAFIIKQTPTSSNSTSYPDDGYRKDIDTYQIGFPTTDDNDTGDKYLNKTMFVYYQ